MVAPAGLEEDNYGDYLDLLEILREKRKVRLGTPDGEEIILIEYKRPMGRPDPVVIPSPPNFNIHHVKGTSTPKPNKRRESLKPTAICQFISQRYNLTDLNGLCLDLNIDFENLRGEVKMDKIQALFDYCKRHDCLDKLMNFVEEEHGIIDIKRMNHVWKDYYE